MQIAGIMTTSYKFSNQGLVNWAIASISFSDRYLPEQPKHNEDKIK